MRGGLRANDVARQVDNAGEGGRIGRALDPHKVDLVPGDVGDEPGESEQRNDHQRDDHKGLAALLAAEAIGSHSSP